MRSAIRDNRDLIRWKLDDRQLLFREVLLIAQVLVSCYEHVKLIFCLP